MIRKLASQTAVYGLSSIIGRFLNYLLVPIYTRVFVGDLGKAEYGVSTWFYAIAAFAGVIFTYGMETAFFRFAQKEGATKERVFSTTLISLIVSSVLFATILIFFATPIANWNKQNGHEMYFRMFAVVFAADAIATIPFAWLRLQNQAMRFATLRLLSIGVNIGLNLLCYVVVPFFAIRGLIAPLDTEGVSVKWMFIINMVSSVVVLPFFIKEFKMLREGFDIELWRQMLKYAYPIIFMGLAGMINETFDRYLLNMMLPPETAKIQLGIYGANYKLSIIITLFIQAFRFSAEPFFFAQAKNEDSRLTNARVTQIFMLVCATIFIGVLMYIDIFKHFIGEEYHEGLAVVPILLMANLFLGAYYNLSIWYKLIDKTQLGAIVSLIGAAITLILNYLWIPTMGYIGSAWATLICYFSMAAMSFFLGQKYYPVPYPTRKIIAYLCLALTCYMISDMIVDNLNPSTPLRLVANTFIFTGYCWTVYKLEEKFLQPLLEQLMQKIKKNKPKSTIIEPKTDQTAPPTE